VNPVSNPEPVRHRTTEKDRIDREVGLYDDTRRSYDELSDPAKAIIDERRARVIAAREKDQRERDEKLARESAEHAAFEKQMADAAVVIETRRAEARKAIEADIVGTIEALQRQVANLERRLGA
jgi:uncharacterized protein YceH (UPF0502 family)